MSGWREWVRTVLRAWLGLEKPPEVVSQWDERRRLKAKQADNDRRLERLRVLVELKGRGEL